MQPDLAQTLFTIVILVYSIVLHEIAHGYAALRLGDTTAKLANRLTLNPIRHVDPVGSVIIPGLLVITSSPFLFGWAKPVPYNPANLRNARWGEAIVAVAGAATNFLLALIFALVARYCFSAGYSEWGQLASIVVLINVSLAIFNLIPIPPFDGFTVLRGLLPIRMSLKLRTFEDRVASLGIFAFIGVLLLFSLFLAQPFSMLIRTVSRGLLGV